MKLKAFFCYPFEVKMTIEILNIINILRERKVNIEERRPILPDVKFTEDFSLDYDIGHEFSRKGQRDKWIGWMNKIKKCNLFVVWIPDVGNSGECMALLQYALEWQKEKRKINKRIRNRMGVGFNRQDEPYLIQIITKKKNPLIAYAIDYGNQLFETVEDFIKLRMVRWD